MPLKVFRTPIGFHDAYVAATSQKAALAAWGADKDLFARGVAEIVTDPALTAAPLAQPGTIIRRLRGTAEEQIAAAPVVKKKAAKATIPARPKPKPPRPDCADVDAAGAALATAEGRHRTAEAALAAEEQALADRRRALRAEWTAERDRLEAARDAAEHAYAAALERWRAG